MLYAGPDLAAVLHALEVSEKTGHRWRNQCGGIESEEVRRLKGLAEIHKRLPEIVAARACGIRMLNHRNSKNW